MLKKLDTLLSKALSYFAKIFKIGRFVTPEVNKKLDNAIDDKKKAWEREYQKLKGKHDAYFNEVLKTFFAKEYSSDMELEIAHQVCDKTWHKYTRDVNSTSRHITLNKNAFKNKVKAVCDKLIEDKKKAYEEAKVKHDAEQKEVTNG